MKWKYKVGDIVCNGGSLTLLLVIQQLENIWQNKFVSKSAWPSFGNGYLMYNIDKKKFVSISCNTAEKWHKK